MIPCEECGDDFAPVEGVRYPRFCSWDCEEAYGHGLDYDEARYSGAPVN